MNYLQIIAAIAAATTTPQNNNQEYTELWIIVSLVIVALVIISLSSRINRLDEKIKELEKTQDEIEDLKIIVEALKYRVRNPEDSKKFNFNNKLMSPGPIDINKPNANPDKIIDGNTKKKISPLVDPRVDKTFKRNSNKDDNTGGSENG